MKNALLSIALFAMTPVTVIGCQNDGAGIESVPAVALTSERPMDVQASAKLGAYALFDGAKDSGTASWDLYLRSLHQDDRRYLEDISDRYFGTVHFSGAEDREALLRLGFPLPEEWLAAKGMSEAELRAMSDRGDHKAEIFLVDRLLAKMAAVTAQAGAENYLEVVKALPEAERPSVDKDRLEVLNRSADVFSEGPTPFTAYQYGVAFSAATGSPEPIPAAMAMAAELGDRRAEKLMADYDAKSPAGNPKLVSQLHATMRKMAKRPAP